MFSDVLQIDVRGGGGVGRTPFYLHSCRAHGPAYPAMVLLTCQRQGNLHDLHGWQAGCCKMVSFGANVVGS
jgi:hypothetical protein